jgi:hypothetical protein
MSSLETCAPAPTPILVTTYAGDIIAEWRASEDRRAWAEFLWNGIAAYLVVSPDRRRTQVINRVQGAVSVEALGRRYVCLEPR